MLTDGSSERTRAEAVNTAWGNNMEWVLGFVLGAAAHWAWTKWNG